MTTIFQHNVRCSVCGNERMTTGVGSYSTMGMLISGKPLFMGLDPLDRMIEICPKCGYCSPDLSSSLGLDPSVLESDGYKDARELGGGLGAYAYILSQRGEHSLSAEMYLRAAWISDGMLQDEEGMFEDIFKDEPRFVRFSRLERAKVKSNNRNYKKRSDRCRIAAIAEFRKIVPTTPEERIKMADMLRCLGRFEEAADQVAKLLSDPRAEKLWGLALLESDYIEKRDTGANHVVDEVPESPTTVHPMKMCVGTVESLVNGRKVFEPHPMDRKTKGVPVGQIIEFTDRANMKTVYADVTSIRCFDTFEDLYAEIDGRLMDPDNPDPKASDMKGFCSKDQERESGVVAIGVSYHPIPEGW